MRISFNDRLFGYFKLYLTHDRAVSVMDMLIRSRVIFKTYESNERGVILLLPYCELGRLRALFGNEYGKADIRLGGSVRLFKRYKSRPGLIVGAVLAFLMIFYCSRFVWRIEVEGNEHITREYVLETLGEYGLTLGAKKAAVELDALEKRIVISETGIGWLSVNFRGTTAFVELIEYVRPQSEHSKSDPCNLVARRDGNIVSLEVYDGVAEVKVGESVREGELLIGGIVDSNAVGYKLEGADGRVYAEVCDEFDVEIPYETTQKVATGRTKSENVLVFFGKRIKLSENSGNSYEKCDIIETNRDPEFLKRLELPFGLVEISYNEYEEVRVTQSESQACTMAYKELEDRLAELAARGEITHRNVSRLDSKDSYVLHAVVYHIEEISEVRPISHSEA